MANHYRTSTGVLTLREVTPVIQALFGDLELDPTGGSFPNEAYIAQREDTCASWSTAALAKLLASLNITLPQEAGEGDDYYLLEQQLHALAEHFKESAAKVEEPDVFVQLVAKAGQELCEGADATVELRFRFARAFDDGHGLTALTFEGADTCSQPRLWEFGGYTEFISDRMYFFVHTGAIRERMRRIDELVAANDLGKASEQLVAITESVITCLNSQEHQEELRRLVAANYAKAKA